MSNQRESPAPAASPRNAEAVREFISVAAHDLREPLRAIRLGAQLLTEQGGDHPGENRERGTRYLQDAVARMETLIQDIAEYCYAEAREPDSGETDLEIALLEAKAQAGGDLRTSGAILTHDALPTVPGNAGSVTVLLRCLIQNACKFRRETATLIHVGAVLNNGEWLLSVRDNGAGFDPAYRERIFRPFERLNGKRYPGSGLGLALSRLIVEQHGGRIWAESVPGEGSTFYFTLPTAG